jgi:hypothetical protein
VAGRRYLGLCAHGRRFKHVLIRVFVAELAAAQTLFDKYGGAAAVDPYMTLVGYFNSLRELGGMRRLVEDDVASRLGQIDAHGLAKRRRPEVQELTSRLGSSGIPRVLDQLQVPFRSGPRPSGATWPIDVLLATNMIAVGVDVPRLGAMVVGGQPKSTAEYIQATSRIGRAHPGLVLTVLNWARPRDLSHYETFEHYHATFYRQVEALSITPFAARALDRGLTAVLASLVRLSGTELNANLAAGQLDRHHEALKRVVATVRARAEQVADEPGVGDEVTHRLEARLDSGTRRRPSRTAASAIGSAAGRVTSTACSGSLASADGTCGPARPASATWRRRSACCSARPTSATPPSRRSSRPPQPTRARANDGEPPADTDAAADRRATPQPVAADLRGRCRR